MQVLGAQLREWLSKQSLNLPLLQPNTQATNGTVVTSLNQQQHFALPPLDKEQVQKSLVKAASFLRKLLENSQQQKQQATAPAAAVVPMTAAPESSVQPAAPPK